jgi:hypothetical protein
MASLIARMLSSSGVLSREDMARGKVELRPVKCELSWGQFRRESSYKILRLSFLFWEFGCDSFQVREGRASQRNWTAVRAFWLATDGVPRKIAGPMLQKGNGQANIGLGWSGALEIGDRVKEQ